MVTVPNTIYSETYGWFTGFFSYIPATVLSLFILFTVVKMIESHDTVSEMQLWVFFISKFVWTILLGESFHR